MSNRCVSNTQKIVIFTTVLLVATFVWLFWFIIFGQNVIGIDDANIFKAYAQNLANGFGFVFQPGGERVEGFTSLLYVLLLSLLYSISGNIDFSGLLLSVSIFLLVIASTIALLMILCQRKKQQISLNTSVGLLLTWLFASPYFVIWLSLTQMDTGLWTLTVLLAMIWCFSVDLNKNRRLQMVLGSGILLLLILTRPEGMLLSALLPSCWFLRVLLSTRVITGSKLRYFRDRSLIGIGLIGVWLGSVFGLTWFRLTYFGWPLPNTYYAKFSPDTLYRIGQGILYAWSFVSHQPVVFISISLICYLIFLGYKTQKKLTMYDLTLFGLVASLLFFIPIMNGGDHFAGWRMYQPIWPILGLAVAWFLTIYPPKWYLTYTSRYSSLLVTLTLGILLVISQPYLIEKSRLSLDEFAYEFAIADNSRIVGILLNSWFSSQSKPVVGVISAGGIAMTYQGEIYDLLGLNETAIAHDGGLRKGLKNHASLNIEMVAEKKPDILFPIGRRYGEIITSTQLSEVIIHNSIFAQILFNNQALKNSYELVWITQEKSTAIGIHPSTVGVAMYVRKDFLESLRTMKTFQVQEIAVK
ncbi:hypothetical protein KBC89_05095 [Candidatus Woesebacteria bacterium]|nr:hypothetical protein [Candidatus Woesebacteria bacterium]